MGFVNSELRDEPSLRWVWMGLLRRGAAMLMEATRSLADETNILADLTNNMVIYRSPRARPNQHRYKRLLLNSF